MIDNIERSYLSGYEQGAKDYKEQRDLLLQENAELLGKIEQLQKERDALLDQSENYGHTKECDDCGWYTWAAAFQMGMEGHR